LDCKLLILNLISPSQPFALQLIFYFIFNIPFLQTN